MKFSIVLLAGMCAACAPNEPSLDDTVSIDSAAISGPINSKVLHGINGTYTNCLGRSGRWSVAVHGYNGSLPNSTLSVIKNNTACTLRITSVVFDTTTYNIYVESTFTLGSSYLATPVGFTDASDSNNDFYLNAKITPATYSGNITLDFLYSADPNSSSNDATVTTYSGYSLGWGCNYDSDCSSGYCRDGVCCDTDCGGGYSWDCQSCSASESGGTWGTCSAVGLRTPSLSVWANYPQRSITLSWTSPGGCLNEDAMCMYRWRYSSWEYLGCLWGTGYTSYTDTVPQSDVAYGTYWYYVYPYSYYSSYQPSSNTASTSLNSRFGINRYYNYVDHYFNHYSAPSGFYTEANNFFYLYPTYQSGTTAFYQCRINANGYYFYTQASNCEGGGTTNQGAIGYIATYAASGTTPLYRVVGTNGTHYFTPNYSEWYSITGGCYYPNFCSGKGWAAEGYAGYVWTTP